MKCEDCAKLRKAFLAAILKGQVKQAAAVAVSAVKVSLVKGNGNG